jgi:pilus assembly protein FimV
MARSARTRLFGGAAVVLLAGALGGACGSSPPTDQNFGTNLGADFRAPHIDAGSGDTNVTPEAGADDGGHAGAAGTSGAAGAGGAAGSAGAAGVGGAAGSSGAAGSGGAGGARDAGGAGTGG